MILLLALACGGQPQTLADCARLGDPSEAEECRYTLVSPLVGDKKALAAALSEVEATAGAQSHDLLVLRLAIAEPSRAGALCAEAKTEGAQEKCRQVLGRPHLGTTRRAPQAPQGE